MSNNKPKPKGGWKNKQLVYQENVPKFLRPYMDKNKEDINQKSATLLDRNTNDPELEDEKPLLVADDELVATYEKQLKEQQEQEKRQQEERRKNEEKRMKARIIAESNKLGNLTEETTHVFQTNRDKTKTTQFTTKRERPEAGQPKGGLAQKRQKLLSLQIEDDDDDLKKPAEKKQPMSKQTPKLSFADEDEDTD